MEHDIKKAVAAWSSVVWSALLTAMKFVVGIMTGSLGIMSEALHSALDLAAAAGTLFAVKVSARPADDDHPYGHGKVENLMALAETLLLFLTAAWVVNEAYERLTSDDPNALTVETSLWAFVVVLVSIAVDVNRAAMLRRVAKETKSAALEADAAHFATDIWSSVAVLCGISGAALADMTTQGTWLHWFLQRADVFGSLVVALFILNVCRLLGTQAVNSLMDKANGETAEKIRTLMKQRMPAYPVSRLRVREVGNRNYVEMVVLAPKHLHVDTAHEIADAIEALLRESLSDTETLVHIQPMEDDETLSREMVIRRIALTHRFGVHGLVLMESDAGLIVTADLELPRDVTLRDWQVPIRSFRQEVRRHLNAARVEVHVEPDVRELPHGTEPDDWQEQVRRAMIHIGAPLPLAIDTYRQENASLCLISIPAEYDLTVEESHTRLSTLNKRLTAELPHGPKLMLVYAEKKAG